MRFEKNLPLQLVEVLSEISGVRFPVGESLPFRPSPERLKTTIGRVAAIANGSRTAESRDPPRTVRDLAEVLLEVAKISSPAGCREAETEPGHLRTCPACRKNLLTVLLTALSDLNGESRRGLVARYGRLRLYPLREYAKLDLGAGSEILVLAETEQQIQLASRAVEELWCVPLFVSELAGALERRRNEKGAPFTDGEYAESVRRFVVKTTVLRFVRQGAVGRS